jgi:hypothetical protein
MSLADQGKMLSEAVMLHAPLMQGLDGFAGEEEGEGADGQQGVFFIENLNSINAGGPPFVDFIGDGSDFARLRRFYEIDVAAEGRYRNAVAARCAAGCHVGHGEHDPAMEGAVDIQGILLNIQFNFGMAGFQNDWPDPDFTHKMIVLNIVLDVFF